MKKQLVFSKTKTKAGPDDDDLDEIGSGSFFYMYNDTKVVNDVDAYLDGPIEHWSKYRHLLQYMRKMEEQDKLTIWVSSPGGYFDTAMQLIEAMNSAQGSVIVNVTGAASSAAGMIALGAPQLIISEQAYMLCHAASYGTQGKQGNVESMVVFNQELLNDRIRRIYAGFLTESEIEQMLIGRDYWFDSPEIIRRLDLRQEWMETQMVVAGK